MTTTLDNKTIGTGSPKKARTAGAVKRKKAPKPSSVEQPENYGYPITLRRDVRAGYRIISGCRNFSPPEARAHWTMRTKDGTFCPPGERESCESCSNILKDRARARSMLKLLPLLATRAKRYGWLATKAEGG